MSSSSSSPTYYECGEQGLKQFIEQYKCEPDRLYQPYSQQLLNRLGNQNGASPFMKQQYCEKADIFWNRFYNNNKTGFFKDRHWIMREFVELNDAYNHEMMNHNHHTNNMNHNDDNNSDNNNDNTNTTNTNNTSENRHHHQLVKYRFLEAGCGVGNTFFPLVQNYFSKLSCFQVYAFDFSRTAVQLIHQHDYYMNHQLFPNQVTAFVHDLSSAMTTNQSITNDNSIQNNNNSSNNNNNNNNSIHDYIPESCIDFCTCIFVLSAISPHKFNNCVDKIASCVTLSTGIVFIRDYARNDLAQTRFQTEKESYKKIEDHFYVRGDGTRAYYFSTEEMVELFTRDGYFETIQCDYCEKQVVNVKEQKQMNRVFVQARFRRTSKPFVLSLIN